MNQTPIIPIDVEYKQKNGDRCKGNALSDKDFVHDSDSRDGFFSLYPSRESDRRRKLTFDELYGTPLGEIMAVLSSWSSYRFRLELPTRRQIDISKHFVDARHCIPHQLNPSSSFFVFTL